MTTSQGTSKAGEMDWEKKIREVHENWMLTEENGSYNWDGKVDDEIIEITRQAIQQAIAQERERIRAGIKVLHEQNNEASPADDIEAVDERAYNAALFDVLKLITNNHE